MLPWSISTQLQVTSCVVRHGFGWSHAVLCCAAQVADYILANPADKTKVSLVFANVSEGDILLKVQMFTVPSP